jgi:hypothetical protein
VASEVRTVILFLSYLAFSELPAVLDRLVTEDALCCCAL